MLSAPATAWEGREAGRTGHLCALQRARRRRTILGDWSDEAGRQLQLAVLALPMLWTEPYTGASRLSLVAVWLAGCQGAAACC